MRPRFVAPSASESNTDRVLLIIADSSGSSAF